jgi:hypothetical protein
LTAASLELLAPRAAVWAFLAEPYNLPDWWPGLTGVEPDRRGFAPGARWKALITTSNPFVGRRPRETLLLVREIDEYERWTWHLLATKLDVEIRLRASSHERSIVRISTSRGRRSVPATAARRLYDLCQTAAEI